ncbi:MAG: helix-turn-helix domain-containing protein [Solirubrobacteraceae bacterium]|jgi:AcrR family transcriptional regulator
MSLPPADPKPRPRPRRADADRNRQRLLAAAADTFTERGADASLNEVARNAGVGAATLYRHFADRQALLDALLADRHRALASHADSLTPATDPAAALIDWLGAFVGHVCTYRGLARIVRNSRSPAAFESSFAEVIQAAKRLLDRAQTDCCIRGDIDACELIDLATAIAISTEGDSAANPKRLLTLMFEGLEPRAQSGPAHRL